MYAKSLKVNKTITTTYEQLRTFLKNTSPEQNSYGLRAEKKEKGSGANKQIYYVIFKRDSSETWCDWFKNFFFQRQQRKDAREALKSVFFKSGLDARDMRVLANEIDDMERLLPSDVLDKISNAGPIQFGDPIQPSQAKVSMPERQAVVTVSTEGIEEVEEIPAFESGNKKKAAFPKLECQLSKNILGGKAPGAGPKNPTASTKPLPKPEPGGKHEPRAANTIAGIQICRMENLDLQDLHPSVSVLMRNSTDYFNMSETCQTWLNTRMEICPPHADGASFARLEIEGKADYLAAHIENKPGQEISDESVEKLADIYKNAVDEAVENGRPLLLTPLFSHDEKSINRLLSAMLAPVYEHLRAGRMVKLEIRTTCPKIAASLEKYKLRYPSSALPLHGDPLPQIRPCLSEAELANEGMIMVAPETISLADKNARQRLEAASARFADEPFAERAQLRRKLGEKAKQRWYFFAPENTSRNTVSEPRASGARKGWGFLVPRGAATPPAPGKETMADIDAKLEACYREAFAAARKEKCRFLSLPLLESWYAAFLSKEAAAPQLVRIIDKVRRGFPEMQITVLTRNPHAEEYFRLLASAAADG